MAIRATHNLESKTIIVQKSLDSIAPNEYKILQNFFKSKETSLAATYSYLMYAKSCFVLDSITHNLTTKNILWLDFGFNHGNGLFYKSKEFDFMLQERSEFIIDSKMNLFTWGIDSNDKPCTTIGGLMYGNKRAWKTFNTHMNEAFLHFINMNMLVDDQVMQKYCTAKYPQDFNILLGYGWFDALFYFIEESKAKKLSLTKATILQRTLNQKEILNYTKSRQIKGNYFQKLCKKLKLSTEKRMIESRIFIDKILGK